MPRSVDLVVISDVHLGTPSCKAEALLGYLDGLRPAELVLNGDIVDLRELRRGFWPAAHTEVMRRLLAYAADGVPVHYVTGNHDHVLRLFSSFKAGSIHLVDHLERNLGGRRTWFLHGDLIEKGMGTPALLRAAGCVAYKLLRGAERANDAVRAAIGAQPSRLSARAKAALAGGHISRYEDACARFASAHGYSGVVCGHIHAPNVREIDIGGRPISYVNSGDWVDSQSALEWHDGAWSVRRAGATHAAGAMPALADVEPIAQGSVG